MNKKNSMEIMAWHSLVVGTTATLFFCLSINPIREAMKDIFIFMAIYFLVGITLSGLTQGEE